MLLVVEVGAVLEMVNPVQGWMASCLGLVLINAMEELERRRRVARRAIPEKPLYVHFLHDLVRGGRAARGRSSAVVAAAASLEVEVVGRRRASREAAVVEVRLRTRRSAATSSFYKEWTTSRAA